MTRPKAAVLLEKIARIIPGIAGYQDRETCRNTDRIVREKAAQSIRRCREGISRTIDGLSRKPGGAGLTSIGPLENLSNRLERLEDGLRYAVYGYAGWFSSTGVMLEDLERLYQYDLDLLVRAESIFDVLPGPGDTGGDAGWMPRLSEEIDLLLQAVEDRRKVLEGEG